MSEGPIKQWRDSWKPQIVSTPRASAVHARGRVAGRGYCGRKGAVTAEWSAVTCADCCAARRADEGQR